MVGQFVAWTVEAIRRRDHGIALVRCIGRRAVRRRGPAPAQWSARRPCSTSFPTTRLAAGLVNGFSGRWVLCIAIEVALLLVAVALGAVPAHLAARRAARDELRVESGSLPRPPAAPLARSPVWSAPTAARSGAPYRCVAASPSWPSGPASSRWPATSTGRR